MIKIFRLFTFVIFGILFGCTTHSVQDKLEYIDSLCDYMPAEAIRRLENISSADMSESDRHYRDLLRIKAHDKAYINHVSDSLILDVIQYYSDSDNKELFVESLYYGGRVYSDLGDYPTALSYFQSVLDKMTDENICANLKSKALSQTSDILFSLRLPEDAKRYSEEALRSDIKVKDSVSVMYDYEQLGNIEVQSRQYESAERFYRKAKHFASLLNKSDTISLDVSLASVKYYMGDIDSALILIRPTVKAIDSLSKNTALSIAALIYQKANIRDTAILYARELVARKDLLNHKAGYGVLLSDSMLTNLPKDSVIRYVRDYRKVIESYLDRNGNQSAFIQNSIYNYQKHLRDKIKAENDSIRQKLWIIILIIALVAVLIFLTCIVVINRYRTVKLQMALFTITQMRMDVTRDISSDLSVPAHRNHTGNFIESSLPYKDNNNSDIDTFNSKNIKTLIKSELDVLLENATDKMVIPAAILDSDIYRCVCQDISDKKVLSDNSAVWQKLEETICKGYPMFKMRLNNLGGHKLNRSELHILLLVKIGISPTNISILLGRSKSTISFNRHSIAKKLFEEKIEIEKIDQLIRVM